MSSLIRGPFAALSFLTRLPCPISPHEGDLRLAPAWFPVIGGLVGGFGIVTWEVFQGIDTTVAALMTVACTVMFTGAMHEDALADSCDGLGGGWTRADKLRIMKDSRIGTYGVTGLVLALLLEIALVKRLLPLDPQAFIVAHVIARWSPVALLRRYPNASLEGSRIPAFAEAPSFGVFAFAGLTAFGLGWWLVDGALGRLAALAVATTLLWGLVCNRHVGGITGDLAGASVKITLLVLMLGSL